MRTHRRAYAAASTCMPSDQMSDFRDIRLLIRQAGILCGSCLSGQRFAFGFLPTIPHNTAVAAQLTLLPDRRVEDLHLQVGAPCRAHNRKGRGDRHPAYKTMRALMD